MINLQPGDPSRSLPQLPISSLLDIMFIVLIFFMTLSVYYQLENEISISVPKAESSEETGRTAGEIIINIDKEGGVTVNQARLDHPKLTTMLQRLSRLYPNQAVIIRADKKTHHEDVVHTLDACAAAGIWNIAFATERENT